jgi:hypothetical protein
MKTAQEHFEKAVKEFVYPVELATQEDIDWIVTPMREALKDWLEEIQRFMIPWGTLEVKAKVDFITVLLDRIDSPLPIKVAIYGDDKK